jgi:hypothetical protein
MKMQAMMVMEIPESFLLPFPSNPYSPQTAIVPGFVTSRLVLHS